ncbi:putative type VI secretion system effector [Herbaspirillum seropedicae]|uniref:putative type VI secretion system effector n=1 Tax=Herbaspirillum seropedicae TaxID=964 RepID=UPI003D98310B
MDQYLETPGQADGFIKISGGIKKYVSKRGEASFVLTKKDKTGMGMVSVALAATGMGAQAIATASNGASLQEEADYVEFDLDGKKVKGWLWRSPFKEGDIVDAVVAWQGDYFELVALAKPSDRMIALYPHCVRGRIGLLKIAAKWWLILFFVFSPMLMGLLVGLGEGLSKVFSVDFISLWGGGGAICTFVQAMLMRQWFPFVRTAQRVFNVFGWKNASSIDFVKTTRQQRKPDDPPELGVYYFKY